MTSRSLAPIGVKTFVSCLNKALTDYEINEEGLAQTDLLPTAALLAGHLLRETHVKREPTICVSRLNKDSDRKWVSKQLLEQMKFEVEPFECMLDIFCCTGKQPYQTLLTIECEGASGYGSELTPRSTPESSDFLWDFFKLLQVPSPLRIFMALCTEKNGRVDLLEHNIGSMVKLYRNVLGTTDEIFLTVFPASRLKGKRVNVYRWVGSRRRLDSVDNQIVKFARPHGTVRLVGVSERPRGTISAPRSDIRKRVGQVTRPSSL